MPASGTALRILIVEDEALIATDLATQIAAFGHQVVGQVSTADEALRIAASAHPDLALIDISIPGPFDGVDCARLLRSRFGTRVAFCTAVWGDRLREAMQMGPVLQKPADPARVADLLASLQP